MKASCTASAASSRLDVVRSATAYIRSRWRRNSSPNAAPPSPSTCRASRSRSLSWLRSADIGVGIAAPASAGDHDLVEPGPALAVVVGGELGVPDDDVLAADVVGDVEADRAVGVGLLPDLRGALETVVGPDVDLDVGGDGDVELDGLGLLVGAEVDDDAEALL